MKVTLCSSPNHERKSVCEREGRKKERKNERNKKGRDERKKERVPPTHNARESEWQIGPQPWNI